MKVPALLVLAAMACQGTDPAPANTSSMSAEAAQETLLGLVARPELTGEQQRLLSTIRGRPSTAEVHVARLAGSPGRMLRQGQAVALALAPGTQVVALGERVERRGEDELSWSGSVAGEPGAVQLVLSGRDVTATVRAAGGVYHVEPLGGGLHAVVRVDQTRLPPDHPPEAPDGTPARGGPSPPGERAPTR
jgi:hypothetical protein